MTKPNEERPTAPLAGFGWAVLALGAFLVAGWFVLRAALEYLPLWLCADRYVAAELEVTRFNPKAGRRGQGRTIAGVIHPSGERVVATTREVGVSHFVDPSEREVRYVPLPAEVEGQRLEVWYWPEHPSEVRWWHPPTVIKPGATDAGGAVARNALIGVALGGAAVFCFRRVWRHVKAASPLGPAGPRTFPWFGITLVLVYVSVLGLVGYLLSL